MVKCTDCRLSRLMQRGKDPIIAECRAKPDGYILQWQREVASVSRCCDFYIKDNNEKEIKKI